MDRLDVARAMLHAAAELVGRNLNGLRAASPAMLDCLDSAALDYASAVAEASVAAASSSTNVKDKASATGKKRGRKPKQQTMPMAVEDPPVSAFASGDA